MAADVHERASVRASGEPLADAVVATLQQDLISGRLRGGDRVPEAALARARGATRSRRPVHVPRVVR